ncbi:helix-turn-helix transcriptional regulator [Paenibacillus sp. strain BS8-2]
MQLRQNDTNYKNAILDREWECFYYASPSPPIALHEHDFCEVLLFLSGDVTYQIAGRSHRLEPGDIVVIGQGTLHQPIFHSDQTYERIVLWLQVSYAAQLSTHMTDLTHCFDGGAVLHPADEKFNQIQSLCIELLSTINRDSYGVDLKLQLTVAMLLLNVNEAYIDCGIPTERHVEKGKYGELIQYIHEHLFEELTTDLLAARFYLSKYHLSREFKKTYGITIHRYITKARLVAAKRLIMDGRPIAEAGRACGFNDYTSFLAAFKKEYGITPKSFYKLMKTNST